MADGTLHGAFELSADQPIRQLHGIRDAGGEADTSLRTLGGTMDQLVSPIAMQRIDSYRGKVESVATTTETTVERMGRSWDSATRKVSDQITVIEGRIDDLDAKLDRFGSKSVDATVGLDGVVEANAQLSELESRLDRLDRRNATARVGLSGGGLFSDFAGRGGGGGAVTSTGGGRGPSSLFQAVGGLPTMALAALGLSPGIMGLLGGATSLVGSAGAAALGAGVVGLGGAGIGVAGGLGAFAGIKEGVVQLQALEKAQKGYTTAVQEYGKASTQAAAAQQKLRQEEVAHAAALPMFRQLTALKSDFTTATAPAVSQFYNYGTDVLYNLRRGIPSFGHDATIATGAVGRAATTYSGFLTSQPSLTGLSTLTSAFATNLPTVERTLQNVTTTMGNLAVAAIPFFHEANVWVANWTGGLARSSSNTAAVQTEMGKLVTSAKDWGRLLGSAAGLLKDIFSAGAPQGNSMVVQLTTTLDRWDQWINNNPQKVDAFFTKAEQTTTSIARGVGQIAHGFAQLGQMLGPIFDRALGLAHILLGLGPMGLSLAGGALFGGLQGLRGAGYGVPSGGALARSYVFGSPGSAASSATRGGGGTVVPTMAGASASAEVSSLERVTRMGAAPPSSVFMMPAASDSPAYFNRYGGMVSPVSGAPVLLAEREAASLTGSLRSAVGTARGALSSLGGGIKTFAEGAGRLVVPLLGFSALLGALQPTTGGVLGHVRNAFSSATGGLVSPTLAVPSLVGGGGALAGGLASRMLAGPADAAALRLLPGMATSPGIAGRVLPFLGGAAARVALGTLGAYAGFMLDPSSAGVSAHTVGAAQSAAAKQLVGGLNAATSPQGAMEIRRQAELQLQRLPWSIAAEGEDAQGAMDRMRKFLEGLARSASDKAGALAATRWTTALDTGLQREKPEKAVSTVLSGMTEQLKRLGTQGSMVMARSMGQWAAAMEQQNPKLIKPMEQLMQGIVDRMNQTNHTVGTTMADLQGKIFWFNGQILKGSQSTWDHIGHALTDPLAVAQERALGIFSQIQKEAINALTQMGIPRGRALTLVTSFSSPTTAVGVLAGAGATPGGATRAAVTTGHARGGVLDGMGLLDTVRLPDGSLAAPGEAWIANRHTMDDLSRATIPMYGKTAWQLIQGETRAHSLPMGVGRGRRAAFGMSGAPGGGAGGQVIEDPGVNMSVGQEPQILQDLYRLSSRLRQAVYVISGWRSPAHSVAVGGFADDPHTRGEAADIGIGSPSRDSMFGVAEGTLNAVGLYRPFYPASAAEVNHVQLLGGAHGAVTGGGARGAMARLHLHAPRGGMLGVPGVLLNRASEIYASALQQQVNRRMGTMGGGSTAGLSGSLVSMVHQLSHRFGWGPADVSAWLQVINAESGGSLTATNPSSGAYGIAQFINGPSEYAQYGGNSATQGGQLLAMANYISGRYGTPTAAWGHEQSDHWYERGGKAAWGGWHHRGADFTTNGPVLFGAGDGRRERVRITPAASQTARGRGGNRVTVIMQHVELSSKPQDIERVAEAVGQKILDHLDSADDSDLMGAG